MVQTAMPAYSEFLELPHVDLRNVQSYDRQLQIYRVIDALEDLKEAPPSPKTDAYIQRLIQWLDKYFSCWREEFDIENL